MVPAPTTTVAPADLERLWRRARRLVGPDDAEALVRECLTRAMGDRHPDRRETWLRRHLMDCLRERLGDPGPVRRTLQAPRRCRVTAAAISALRNLDDHDVDRVLARLQLHARVAVVLVLGEREPARRVAEDLGVTIETIHAWLDHAHLQICTDEGDIA